MGVFGVPWRPLKGCGTLGVPREEAYNREPPANLEELLKAAEILGAPFYFIRVDFLLTANGKFYFNEFSTYPTGGGTILYPESCNAWCGQHFEAPTPDLIRSDSEVEETSTRPRDAYGSN